MTQGAQPGFARRPNSLVGASAPAPASTVIATYPDYRQAQRLVDYLSDQGFAIEHVRIIGRGLHSVEQVLTRMTKGKAAGLGAGSGAWFGLFIGLLISLFMVGAWWQPVLLGVIFGALWGAMLGYVGHSATRGKRDFASAQTLVADTYLVEVTSQFAEEAANIAGRLKIADGQS